MCSLSAALSAASAYPPWWFLYLFLRLPPAARDSGLIPKGSQQWYLVVFWPGLESAYWWQPPWHEPACPQEAPGYYIPFQLPPVSPADFFLLVYLFSVIFLLMSMADWFTKAMITAALLSGASGSVGV